jgi:filamentous hemagglutinin family protein
MRSICRGRLMLGRVRSSRLGPPLVAALVAAGPVQAQIVTDGSVGPQVSLSGPQIGIGADLGTRRDDNLFHSFKKFGIATGQTATFRGPDTIKNVISRVTGGEVSNIDGILTSKVGQADLYFPNPAGVICGPNARLDVQGSLHVGTAHQVRFVNGASFSALDKTGSGLTVAPPEAFGFLDGSETRISVDQSQLQLKPGKTLSLIGGDLGTTPRPLRRADLRNRYSGGHGGQDGGLIRVRSSRNRGRRAREEGEGSELALSPDWETCGARRGRCAVGERR